MGNITQMVTDAPLDAMLAVVVAARLRADEAARHATRAAANLAALQTQIERLLDGDHETVDGHRSPCVTTR